MNTQQRVALFIPDLVGGGAQRVMLNLARGIAGHGYAVDLVLAQAEGPYLDQVPDSVRVVNLVSRRREARRTLASLPSLVRYLRRERPAAMLSALNRANFVAVWARRLAGGSVRVVLSEHNTYSVKAERMSKRRAKQMQTLIRLFYPWADSIVAVSKGVADDLAQATGLSRERIRVIYNPVITPELQEQARATLDHPWFQPGEPPVILGVGRLAAQKNFSSLIDAFAKVQKVHPSRLIILGEGAERPMLEALVKQHGLQNDVSLPGFVKNPYAYMANAFVFVLSSNWEGLPTVLIEALCCGTQVIATDCPSGPREILDEGHYGKLVPPGDTAALAEAIEATLAGPALPPSKESWRPFELGVVVDQYIDALWGS